MFQTELLPAQIQFLQNPKKAKTFPIFATVIRHLILEKVLVFHNVKSYPNERSKKTQTYGMVSPGPGYASYEPQFFEKVFLSPLIEIPKIQMRILSDYVIKRYSLPSNYVKDDIYDSVKGEYIKRSLGMYSLKPKGKEVVEQFNTFITEQISKLTTQVHEEDASALIQTVEETGSWLFIIEAIDHHLFEELKTKIKELNRENVNVLYLYARCMELELNTHDD